VLFWPVYLQPEVFMPEAKQAAAKVAPKEVSSRVKVLTAHLHIATAELSVVAFIATFLSQLSTQRGALTQKFSSLHYSMCAMADACVYCPCPVLCMLVAICNIALTDVHASARVHCAQQRGLFAMQRLQLLYDICV
jgi:hypothetical protein